MRFERLDLLKYGKFAGRSIAFPAAKRDFHLIVGPNEAGKSTLRAAILDLLFGIPARSPLSFLHPLNELRLGAVIANGGGSLEFHRAKAQKQTLRSAADEVLADGALTPFLGSADRHFFDQMFGLDHSRLVAGGNSILSAENDVGQVLFQSAAGVASLGKIRDALLGEAEKLWAPRKSAERAYYQGADQLEKATTALKEATVRTKVWAEAHAKVEALQGELAGERERHQALQNQRGRLERVRRLAPFLRSLRDAEQRLVELGEVANLPSDAAARLANAERELATARQLLELRGGEVEKAQQALTSIAVDDAVLSVAGDVTRLDELRLQYGAYERDIERREAEVAALWREVAAASAQLGWLADSVETLAARLPTLLVRRELGQLARERSGLIQGLRAAEQAERAKRLEIEQLAQQLATLQSGEVQPALRAALAAARGLGDPDSALQRHAAAVAKANTALENALQALGRWQRNLAELAAIQPPAAQTLAAQIQQRQALDAERQATLRQRDAQQTALARLELEIAQYNELHHPVTREVVEQARQQRDGVWQALKSGEVALREGAPRFETALRHADQVTDTRLEKVGEASELQSRLHQLAREQHGLAALEARLGKLDADLHEGEARWLEQTRRWGLAGLPLDESSGWFAQREKALAAASDLRDAEQGYDGAARALAAARLALASALRDAGLAVDENDSLGALCVQAESHIQGIDGAKVRRDTLNAQWQSAQAQLAPLAQAAAEARSEAQGWAGKWALALGKAGLPPASEIGSVEGALELIALIEEKLGKMRQIRSERIDAMNADLAKFAIEAQRLAQALAPDLAKQPAAQIAQALAKRLALAREAHAEATRLQEVLRVASAQVAAAREAEQTAIASLQPLLARAGVASHGELAAAIARSDEARALSDEMAKARANLLDGGDGLAREQIEAEVDGADLTQLAADLAQLDAELSAAVQRQAALAAEHAGAERTLADIGGSASAAQAESRRQEALAQMSDAAERYIKVYTAGRLLRWSIDRYREVKQGPLLARAGAIFAQLTLGSFQRLVVDFEREPLALEGQRNDGKLVAISGMSDGTRDQLYLALRLAALELHLEQATPLPFVADDLFINYDDARSQAGLEALAALSEQTQVIFLSHHDHLVPSVQAVFGEAVNVVVL